MMRALKSVLFCACFCACWY